MARLPTVAAIGATAALCFWSLTAYLVFAQAVMVRSRPLLVLATACLTVAVLGVPYLFAYPGILESSGISPNADAANWIWLFGQIAFVVLVVAYVPSQHLLRRPWRRGEARLYAVLATVVALLLTLVAFVPGFLPPLTRGDDFGFANRHGVTLVLFLCYAAALTYAIVATRGRTTLDLWLIVTLLALTLDVLLSSVGGSRYSFGWYMSRFDRTFASGTLLTVFLLDFTMTSRRFATLAGLDVVSGLPNRRALDERLTAQLGNRRRRSDALSVIMLDIDNFKAFNDRYGHAVGDECLRAVADIIRHALVRSTDFAARYGGEEFVVVLPSTDRLGAIVVAERIRVDTERLSLSGIKHAGITVSLGVVTVSALETVTLERALLAADHAMYAAKAAGRNCIVEGVEPFTPPESGNAAS